MPSSITSDLATELYQPILFSNIQNMKTTVLTSLILLGVVRGFPFAKRQDQGQGQGQNATIGAKLSQNANSTEFAKALQANATQQIGQMLNATGMNLTLFAPINGAYTFNLTQGNASLSANPLGLNYTSAGAAMLGNDTWENVTFSSQATPASFNYTLANLFAYHLTNASLANLTQQQQQQQPAAGNQSQNGSMQAMVVSTFLNATDAPVLLPNNASQVFVVHPIAKGNNSSMGLPPSVLHAQNASQNASQSLFEIRYGAYPPAQVVGNVSAANGYIFLVDRVLIPPANASASLAKLKNLTEVYSLLQKANLTERLDMTPGLTIFAPSNQAFQQLNASGLNETAIREVILNHVVESNQSVFYSPVFQQQAASVVSVSGKNLTLQGNTVNGNISIVQPDIITQNGVIHGLARSRLAGPTVVWSLAGTPPILANKNG